MIRVFRQKGQADWNYTPKYQPRHHTVNHDSGGYESDYEPFPWVKVGLIGFVLMILAAIFQSQPETQRLSPVANGTPVFSQPVYGATVVGNIPDGSNVRIGECSGDFVEVIYDGSAGWVRHFQVRGDGCD